MDPTIVSVIAVAVAAIAAVASLLSAKAALKSAGSVGRHRTAEFRQVWINTVIDALSEYTAIVMTLPEHVKRQSEDEKKLATLGTKLGLLLNPNELDAKTLLKLIGDIYSDTSEKGRQKKANALVALARKILKAEWVRIKKELE